MMSALSQMFVISSTPATPEPAGGTANVSPIFYSYSLLAAFCLLFLGEVYHFNTPQSPMMHTMMYFGQNLQT